MRTFIPLTLACALFGATSAVADEATDVKAVIDAAVKAIGGADTVNKQTNSEWSEKGTYFGTGQPIPYAGKYSFSLPNKSRMEIVGVFMIIVNGDKAWMRSPTGVVELKDDKLKEQQQMLHIGYVTSLIPFAKAEKGYKLKLVGDTTVNDEACVAVTCAKDGFQTVKMEFSKKTNLLIKSTYQVVAEDGKKVTEESLFADWKKEDGLMSPRKMSVTRDGKKFVESLPTKVTHPATIDAKLFANPTE